MYVYVFVCVCNECLQMGFSKCGSKEKGKKRKQGVIERWKKQGKSRTNNVSLGRGRA